MASPATAPPAPAVGSVTAGGGKSGKGSAAKPKGLGRRGEMNFSLRRLESPLELQQVTLDPTWNKFKTVMVYVGGILFFFVFGALMFTCGVMGAYRTHPSTQQPSSVPVPVTAPIISAPVVAQPPVVVQPPAPAWSSRWSSQEECEHYYKVVLHQAPAGRCD